MRNADVEASCECTTPTGCYLCLHLLRELSNALHGCTRYLSFARAAYKVGDANVLSAGDYENFRNLDLKMLSIGDDISGLVAINPRRMRQIA